MIEKNWNQSDLARAAFGSDGAGNARGRDAISTYIRGLAFPEPKSLKKLSDAFGCEPHELLPNTIEAAMDNEIPALEIRQASGHPDKVWLRVNQMVSLEVAAKIFDALNKASAATTKE
jgi:transcriptional regulator with XRE-family HTH domain